ncbi:hypothetical protein Tco_0863694 [Tanacetum coccineum]
MVKCSVDIHRGDLLWSLGCLDRLCTREGCSLILPITLQRHAKQKDTNSNKVSGNNNSSLKSIVDIASSNGMKIVTSNPFDFLNMVEKDIVVTPSDLVNLEESENDVEEDNNKTASFMTSKSSKGTCSSKSGSGTGKQSLYDRLKDDYDDNPYDDDEEHEDLTNEQLAFYDAFDISPRSQIRRVVSYVSFLMEIFVM